MAVFPDKIVIKNTADSRASIEQAIQPGGSDAITAGELVVGREDGKAKLYCLDSNDRPVAIGSGNDKLTPFVIDGKVNGVFTNRTSVTIDKPECAKDDTLLAVIYCRGDGLPVTAPAGWTLEGSYLSVIYSGKPNTSLYVYTKTAGASEPANYAWSTNGTSTEIGGSVVSIAYGVLDSVTEYMKAASGRDPIPVSVSSRYLNVIAHFWTYASLNTTSDYFYGAGALTIPNAVNTSKAFQIGYTEESGTAYCQHETNDSLANSAGAIVIRFKVVTGSSGGGGTGGLVFWGGGDFDSGTSDGEQADGGSFD